MGFEQGDTTGGAGLLSKWRQKRVIRKQEKAREYLDETGGTMFDGIINFVKTSWLMIIIIVAAVVFLWRLIFKRKGGGMFRRRSRNSGRSFYNRMKRAKARKAGK